MSNKTYSVSTGAYAVPLLHAAKYPAATVCGVLLGKTDGSKVHVVSALPFFHHWTALTPMLEVALQQAEAYAAHQGLVIVGWYQANKRADDMTLHENAVRVCQTIQNNTQHAIAFVIDNRQLVHLDSVGALVPFTFIENQWRANENAFTGKSPITLAQEDTLAKVRGLYGLSAYRRLVDFDDHLEDTGLDWFNSTTLAA